VRRWQDETNRSSDQIKADEKEYSDGKTDREASEKGVRKRCQIESPNVITRIRRQAADDQRREIKIPRAKAPKG